MRSSVALQAGCGQLARLNQCQPLWFKHFSGTRAIWVAPVQQLEIAFVAGLLDGGDPRIAIIAPRSEQFRFTKDSSAAPILSREVDDLIYAHSGFTDRPVANVLHRLQAHKALWRTASSRQ